jgi:TonB family protein
MQCKRSLLFVIAFLLAIHFASAQDVLTVDKLTLDQHVDHRVAPFYPPIAKAARIQGIIVFHIQVGTTGKIESMKVISGPAMLQQAAIDCLKQWTYHPFEKDGKLVSAAGPVSIEFSLGKDGPTPQEEEIAGRYFPLSDQCHKAISAGTDLQASAKVCKAAADVASEFPEDRRFIEKRSGYVWAASALLYSGDLKTALTYAEKAVDIVKLGHDDNSGSNAAYGIRGMVEGNLGNLTAADQDLTVAEDFERKGIAWAEQVKFEHGDSYKRTLAQELRFHAQVLQGLHRSEDAQKKLDEAAKYN